MTPCFEKIILTSTNLGRFILTAEQSHCKLIKVMKSAPKPTTCYFEAEEKRLIGEIAEKEERPNSKVVQFAVRAFAALYRQDRQQAMQLAQVGK